MVNKLIYFLTIALLSTFSVIAKAGTVAPEEVTGDAYITNTWPVSNVCDNTIYFQTIADSQAYCQPIAEAYPNHYGIKDDWYIYDQTANSTTYRLSYYTNSAQTSSTVIHVTSVKQANVQYYVCPSTHPYHIDSNSNGQIDATEGCSDQPLTCDYDSGEDFWAKPSAGWHGFDDSMLNSNQCISGCSATVNIPATIDGRITDPDRSCYSYPDSDDPSAIYCDTVFTSSGESCDTPTIGEPALGLTATPAPLTTSDPSLLQAPDFLVDDISECTPTGGAFLCQVPFDNACGATGNCNSSCAGHNGSIALCYVDFTGVPQGIPSIGGTGPSVTSTTGSTTTTTTTNADGSTTTTTTATETSVTAGASASAEVDFGSPNCSGETCRQDFYESNDWNDRNFGTVITDFKDRMAQTDIGSGISSFMQIQASASCPVWSADIPMIGVVTFDQLCTSTGSFMLSIIRAVLLFGFTWLAFQWALIRS